MLNHVTHLLVKFRLLVYTQSMYMLFKKNHTTD